MIISPEAYNQSLYQLPSVTPPIEATAAAKAAVELFLQYPCVVALPSKEQRNALTPNAIGMEQAQIVMRAIRHAAQGFHARGLDLGLNIVPQRT